MKRIVVVLVSSFGVIAGIPAGAQVPNGPDNGFFRPSADVALTGPKAAGTSGSAQQAQPFMTLQSSTMPAARMTVPVTPPASVTATSVPNAPAAPANAVPTPMTVQQLLQQQQAAHQEAMVAGPQPSPATQESVERQMDRSVAEAERERARMQATPAGVGAAFDGTTSSENR